MPAVRNARRCPVPPSTSLFYDQPVIAVDSTSISSLFPDIDDRPAMLGPLSNLPVPFATYPYPSPPTTPSPSSSRHRAPASPTGFTFFRAALAREARQFYSTNPQPWCKKDERKLEVYARQLWSGMPRGEKEPWMKEAREKNKANERHSLDECAERTKSHHRKPAPVVREASKRAPIDPATALPSPASLPASAPLDLPPTASCSTPQTLECEHLTSSFILTSDIPSLWLPAPSQHAYPPPKWLEFPIQFSYPPASSQYYHRYHGQAMRGACYELQHHTPPVQLHVQIPHAAPAVLSPMPVRAAMPIGIADLLRI